MQMKVFDIHVHIFPQKIAEKASRAIGKFYDAEMRHDGTLDTAIRLMDEAGIQGMAVHSVATTPAQCAHINEFVMEAKRAYPDRIIPFAAIHPGLEDVEAYVENALQAGFRGFKIHPDIQGFALDRPDAVQMIGAVAGKAPLLIHTGDARYDNSGPVKVAGMLDRFPNLTAICAHLGGYSQWTEAEALLAGRDIYVDCSSSMFLLEPERMVEIMRAYGMDRVFFGSDYPMWTPGEELKRFLALNLTEAEKQAVLWDNAAKFFGLESSQISGV